MVFEYDGNEQVADVSDLTTAQPVGLEVLLPALPDPGFYADRFGGSETTAALPDPSGRDFIDDGMPMP